MSKIKSESKNSISSHMDAFKLDAKKLSTNRIRLSDVNEIVRQMKEHIEKCGL